MHRAAIFNKMTVYLRYHLAERYHKHIVLADITSISLLMTLEGAPGTMLYQMSVLGWLQLFETKDLPVANFC